MRRGPLHTREAGHSCLRRRICSLICVEPPLRCEHLPQSEKLRSEARKEKDDNGYYVRATRGVGKKTPLFCLFGAMMEYKLDDEQDNTKI